jgi:putative hemolysin
MGRRDVTEGLDDTPVKHSGDADYVPYDKRKLSYSGTFTDPWKIYSIRALEWLTGKITLIRRIRAFERDGVAAGQAFWPRAMVAMGVDILTPPEQVANIPATGPVVVVSNHPHGLVDGMVLAYLIGQVRQDYKILSRSLLTGVPEIRQFLIPVPFPHEANSFADSLEMRKETTEHLLKGGVIALFPSGQVACSDGWFGPAVEAEWNPFTAKLIRRSGATVVPIFFPGQNSRLYQIAANTSATLRQGMLLHEVVYSLDKPQAPVVGAPITPEEMAPWKDRPGEFIAWLRDRTLALKPD